MGNDLRHFTAVALLLCLTLVSFTVRAEEPVPPELKNVGIDATLGAAIPQDLAFTDETGAPVKLSGYFHKDKPVILTLVYFECPMLCTLVLNNFCEGLKGLPWTAGGEFEIVTVSINPKETPTLAKAKKESYIAEVGRPQAARGWHFLTGADPAIKALAASVGFKYAWDPAQKQYAHATGIFILTPDGKLSRVLYGIDYPARDLRLALTEAAQGKVGSVVDKLLLFCYHYDPQKKAYSLVAFRVMQLAGTATVLGLVGLIGSLLFLERRQKRKAAATAPAGSAVPASPAPAPPADPREEGQD